MITELVKIDDINIDSGLYPRNNYNWQVAYDYAGSMQSGAVFPPIEVAVIDGKTFLVDGRHRIEATKINKGTHIQAYVNESIKTKDQLYVQAVERNISHGKQFSVHEKVQICVKLADMKYSFDDISRIIHIPTDKLEKFVMKRVTHSVSGETIGVKKPMRATVSAGLPVDIEHVQKDFQGMSQLRMIEQVTRLISTGSIAKDNVRIKRALKRLYKVLEQIFG